MPAAAFETMEKVTCEPDLEAREVGVLRKAVLEEVLNR